MPPHTYRIAGITLLVGVLAVAPLATTQTHKSSAQHDHATPEHTDICAGFVVLPKGHAVLSAMAPAPTVGIQHDMRHAAGRGEAGPRHMAEKKADEHQAHLPPGAQATDANPLLRYQHGDGIPTGKGMTCVPISGTTSTSWTSVSASPDLYVTAKSMQGILAHNSRTNESLALNVVLHGQPVEHSKVRLLMRMPHHDHRMPGGHGPANDPDLAGLEAMPQGNGNYTIPTVDFTMGGPWLFEVQVQDGDTIHKAYFATEIGEE